MLQRKKPGVDIISDVLKATLAAYPESTFIQSLYIQYEERGGLSKKQLQGLYQKASRVNNIPPNILTTLEAVILKKPTKYKSPKPSATPLYTKDEKTGEMISAILAKSPQHKRVLYFQSKYENNEPFSPAETLELEKFYKLFR